MAKMHVLGTWIEGQRLGCREPSIWMNGLRKAVHAETEYVRSSRCHAPPQVYHNETCAT